MDKKQIFRQWADAFEGHLREQDLQPQGQTPDGERLFYVCPCGIEGEAHCASRATEIIGPSRVPARILHCYEYGLHWYIKPVNVALTIHDEEVTYGKLLNRLKRQGLLGKRVSGKEAFYLVTTKGVPSDCLEITDVGEYEKLMTNHRERSRG